jgi:hypothetical protein
MLAKLREHLQVAETTLRCWADDPPSHTGSNSTPVEQVPSQFSRDWWRMRSAIRLVGCHEERRATGRVALSHQMVCYEAGETWTSVDTRRTPRTALATSTDSR